MSTQNKHPNTIMLQIKHYDPGRITEKSNISQHVEDTDDMKLMSTPFITKREEKSSTLVFQVGNNKEILVDRLSSSNLSIPIITPSPISEVELTSNEKDLSPFWKECSTEQSKKLWLPKETDSHGLDLTYLNGFSKNTIHSSFHITPVMNENPHLNYQKTSWQSSLCSAPAITVKENIKYCRKIRIYPTKDHIQYFHLAERATRVIRNNALAYIEKNPGTSLTHISLRKNTMLSDAQLNLPENESFRWMKDVPYDTRQLVLKQLASNFKSNFTQLRKKQITHFEMQFSSKKSTKQYFFVDKKTLNLSSLRIFPRRIKKSFKVRKRMKKWTSKMKIPSDFVIQREKNRYYMCLPMEKKTDIRDQQYTRVALDPGVRTFQTFYSDENIAGKIGDSICEPLIDIGLRIDYLTGILKSQKLSKRTRYNLNKRCFSLRSKMKNITRDLHWKTAHFLCSTFKHILLPSFEVSNMVQKSLPHRARCINSKTVRKMLSLSHFAFKQRLAYMGERMGCHVEIVNEAFSTQTCGGCGMRKKMSGLKHYKCDCCSFELDRDYNGARNIFLKYL